MTIEEREGTGKEREGDLNMEGTGEREERLEKEVTCEEREGFIVVQRRKRRTTFEKFVRVEKVFKKLDKMSEKELEELENMEKRFTRKADKYVVTARVSKEQSTNNRNTNILKIARWN